MPGESQEIKYFSKSNIKSKCRQGYYSQHTDSIMSMRGRCYHACCEKYLLGNDLDEAAIIRLFAVIGLPREYHHEVVDVYNLWLVDTGRYLRNHKDVVCIESNDSEDRTRGMRITQVKLTKTIGIRTIFDYVCIDSITGVMEIRDWKYGMPGDDADFELMFNATIALMRYGVDKVYSNIYSGATGTARGDVFYRDKLPEYKAKILKHIGYIKDEDPEHLHRELNTYCGSCSMKIDCPEYLSAINGTPIFSMVNNIEESLNEIYRLKAIIKACEDEMKLVKAPQMELLEQENVKSGTYEYYVLKVKSWVYPTKEIYSEVKELGFNADDLLSIKSGDITRLINEIKASKGKAVASIVRNAINAHRGELESKRQLRRRLI